MMIKQKQKTITRSAKKKYQNAFLKKSAEDEKISYATIRNKNMMDVDREKRK